MIEENKKSYTEAKLEYPEFIDLRLNSLKSNLLNIEKEYFNNKRTGIVEDINTILKEYDTNEYDLTNYSTLVEFRNKALNNVKATSYNSYLKKIKAICNDAYDNQVIFERPYFSKRLSVKGAKRNKPQTLESDKLLEGIKSCKTIYELQAMCIYLLSFMTRGMYFADLVKFKSSKLRNEFDKNEFMDGWEPIYNIEKGLKIYKGYLEE